MDVSKMDFIIEKPNGEKQLVEADNAKEEFEKRMELYKKVLSSKKED